LTQVCKLPCANTSKQHRERVYWGYFAPLGLSRQPPRTAALGRLAAGTRGHRRRGRPGGGRRVTGRAGLVVVVPRFGVRGMPCVLSLGCQDRAGARNRRETASISAHFGPGCCQRCCQRREDEGDCSVGVLLSYLGGPMPEVVAPPDLRVPCSLQPSGGLPAGCSLSPYPACQPGERRGQGGPEHPPPRSVVRMSGASSAAENSAGMAPCWRC